MRTHQQILDRREAMDAEIRQAEAHARRLKEMSQKAERADLVTDCAAQGHAFVGVPLWGADRICVVCGEPESAQRELAARHLSGEVLHSSGVRLFVKYAPGSGDREITRATADKFGDELSRHIPRAQNRNR